MMALIANHLWQSTIFGGLTALAVLALRRNRAAVRYRLWQIASLKFLVPFANKPIPDPDFNIPDSSFLHDSNHGFVALAGESRMSDANSPAYHVQQGAGPFSVVQTDDLGRKTVSFGGLLLKPEGSRPAKPARVAVPQAIFMSCSTSNRTKFFSAMATISYAKCRLVLFKPPLAPKSLCLL